MRIRTRLHFLIIAILVPAFVAAALGIGYVYVEERQAQETSVRETVRMFCLLVQNEVETNEGILHTLASSPALANGDLRSFYEHAQSMTPNAAYNIVLFDLDGRQIMNSRMPFGAPLPARRLSNIDDLMRRYGADRTLVSDVFLIPRLNQHDFVVQVPVHHGGRVRYLLSMGIPAASLQALLQGRSFPSTWLVAIVDRTGKVLARSQEPDKFRGRSVSRNALQAFTKGREGEFPSISLSDVPVQAFFSSVPGSDWRVVVNIPNADLRRVPLRAAAFLGAIMLLLMVLAGLAARRIGLHALAPVQYLSRSAEDLGHGREVVFEPHGVTELDAVARRMVDASRQIRHAQRDLEQRVAAAVSASEAAQVALVRSQKLEALGRLTGGIAHEFNNLMQTLTTALQLAALTAKQPKVLGLIDTCKRTVTRATALTGQLSSFGRVQDAKLSTIDSGEQVRNAAPLVQGVLRLGIRLDIDCAPDAWPVTVDPLQFDLALLNLAINARDAMPDGGTLRIGVANCTLAADAERPAGDYLRVTVADTGSGMPPDVLTRALDPFFTTKAPGQGSGLGLPQAYAFATQSQGFLHLASVEGKGTTIDIVLPRARQPLSPQPARPGAARRPASGDARVLYVEDDALVREAVVQGLEDAGFDVVVAASGDQAVEMLDAGLDPDVVFSDIVMPGKVSGIDLAHLLRERRPGLPVVLATGYTDQRVSIPGVQVLAKPYEIDQLTDVLAGLKERSG
jgi:signal transduction histidine kinase